MAAITITRTQPDISYHPDLNKFHLRTERLKAERDPEATLPSGFPKELTGTLVWEGQDFKDDRDWTLVLNEEQLAEIHDALLHFKCA